MDGLQAAILLAKLPHLEKWTNTRIEYADAYGRLLESPQLLVPRVREGCRHVFHLYVVRSGRRTELIRHLEENGIETAIHYPQALPFLPCYSDRGHDPALFPNALRNQSEILSLPLFPEMSLEQIRRVANAIHSI